MIRWSEIYGVLWGVTSEQVTDMVFGMLISGIVGVRLFFVLTHLGDFHPWYKAFFIWDGGLTLYGGILASTTMVYVLARRRGIPFLVMADIFAPGVLMGVASETVMGPSRHLTGAFTVLVGGAPATRMTNMSLQNSTNCPGARVVPSQTKVLILAP